MSDVTRILSHIEQGAPIAVNRLAFTLILVLTLATPVLEAAPPTTETEHSVLLVPEGAWDGVQNAPQKGVVILIKGNRLLNRRAVSFHEN